MSLEVPSDADYSLYSYVKLFRPLINCTIWLVLGYSTNIFTTYNTFSQPFLRSAIHTYGMLTGPKFGSKKRNSNTAELSFRKFICRALLYANFRLFRKKKQA